VKTIAGSHSRGIALPLVLLILTLLFMISAVSYFLLTHGRGTLSYFMNRNETVYHLEVAVAKGIWLSQHVLWPHDYPYREQMTIDGERCELAVSKTLTGLRVEARMKRNGKTMAQAAVLPHPVPFPAIMGKP